MKTKKGRGRQMLVNLAFPILCIIILSPLIYWTLVRNEVYQDEVHFWLDVTNKSPNKVRPWCNAGSSMMRERAYGMAKPFLERAIFLIENTDQSHKSNKPAESIGETYSNYAILLSLEKRYEEAINYTRMALEIQPFSAEFHNNMGLWLLCIGKREDGIKELKEAIRFNPYLELARQNLEIIQKGKNYDAVKGFY